MRKKNILFILPWLPYPLKSGGHQAIYNGIKSVCNEINTIITFVVDEKAHNHNLYKELNSTLNNNIIIEPYIIKERRRKGINKIIHFIHVILWKIKKSVQSTFATTKLADNTYKNWIEELLPKEEDYLQHINQLIDKYNIEIVQCEMLGNCSIVLSIPQNIKKVFVHHEIGFIRNQQELKTNNNNNLRNTSLTESKKIQEIGLLNRFDCIITLSELDKNILKHNGVQVPIHSSIATTNNIYDYKKESNSFHTLTFVGPEFHTPNVLGIKWFLENCWDKLKDNDPFYSLNIIGNWSETTKTYFIKKYKDIHFLGYVNNLSVVLRNTIMIVPITIGSGIRMKILEAASIGVPMITTTIGASGIILKNEYHCFICDMPEDFVDSILKLKDKDIRLNMIERSYNLITENYSIQALKNNRLSIYETLS